MAKIRVYQLARELNRDNGEVIRELQHIGAPVTSHSNTVEDRMAEQLRKTLGVLVIEKPKPKRKAAKKTTEPKVEEKKGVEETTPEPKVIKAKPKPKPVEVVESPEEKVVAPAAKVAAPEEAKPETPRPVEPPKVAPAPPRVVTPPPGIVTPPPGIVTPRPAQPAAPVARPRVEAPPKAPDAQKPAAAAPPAQEPRKTMQQLAQERLRQQNRPVPSPHRRPISPRDSRTRTTTPRPTQGRTAPPAGGRPWIQKAGTAKRDRPRPTRAQRVMSRRPMPRPQPKPEPIREFRRVTLAENVTVKEIAEKLEARTKDVIKKLMDRGVFATLNHNLDKELAGQLCKDFNAEADFVTIEVGNPEYEQLQVRFSVLFQPGRDKGLYTLELEQDIIEFLSPWLYDDVADLTFGGRIHRSWILNHIEELEYVDFVTDFRLDHIVTETVMHLDVEEALATSSSAALVSAPIHVIDHILSTCKDEAKPVLAPPGETPQTLPSGTSGYLGNVSTRELHDLSNLTAQCQIDEIAIDRRYHFGNVSAAKAMGYDLCAYCFSREESKR